MAYQAPLEPKDKSDSKWLRDAGYSGDIRQFMISYGLKFPDEIDEAKKLIDEFRKEQQEEWEAGNTKKQKTDPKLIEAAMLWHQRLGHASYHAVKHAPQATTGMGVDFSDLHVEDMPACSSCSRAGLNPFAESE